MLYWLYTVLNQPGSTSFISKLSNVFQYQTFRAIVACLLAFVLSLLFGSRVIRKLISMKMGQPVRTEAEVHKLFELHGKKAGTPTMGGVLILFTLVTATLVCCPLDNPLVWVVLYVTLALGALGFVDDFLKVSKQNSQGVSESGKIIVQLVVGLTAGFYLYRLPGHESFFHGLQIPFIKPEIFHVKDMGWFSVVFFCIVIVGCSNAVNFTDGLDGLASGCTVSCSLAYALFCYFTGHSGIAGYLNISHDSLVGELTPLCLALTGAAIGFLWFNCFPARVFMGDTGSMAIGGCIAAVAICSRQELALIFVGGVFVVEALSVMAQRFWYKLSRKLYGQPRRLFRMAPIHHHFELKGWKESQVIVRFWILSVCCALLGLATLKLR